MLVFLVGFHVDQMDLSGPQSDGQGGGVVGSGSAPGDQPGQHQKIN